MGCRMVSLVSVTWNRGGFIPEGVRGREQGRGFAEGPCFPREGRARGRRTGKALSGISKEEVAGGRGVGMGSSPAAGIRNGGKRSSPSSCCTANLQVEFRTCNDKHALNGQLPPKCHTAEGRKKPKPLTGAGIRPALSALPGATGPFPGLVAFELLPKAPGRWVPAVQ